MKLIVISLLLLLPVTVYANNIFLSTLDGKANFDESRYPARMKAGIAILNSKCDSCHSLARVINAIETGQTASGLPFNDSTLRQFVIRKMRRPDMKMDTKEAAELLRVMQYMLSQTP